VNISRGNNALLALDVSDGSMLWEYKTDDVMWNFKASTPGDGSIIFSSSCGAVHRIDFEGNLLWKRHAHSRSPSGDGFCSMGGGAVGSNGVFYTVHGQFEDTHGKAFINAYRIHDGERVWSKVFNEFGAQYPAVGHLGTGGPLVVVAPLGGPLSYPGGLELPEGEELVNVLVTMDATTGDVLWRFEEEPWPYSTAAGDSGPIQAQRMKEAIRNPRRDVICWPDPQAVPVISGDGYIYASSSHNGDLYALKDEDQNGQVNSTEVSTFATGIAFLNSPSVAPGMLVASPCWGPMYIFRDHGRQS
jgi:outer membrane protein assembly factor BamB